jgi:D-xylose transport system substrate-binding protein
MHRALAVVALVVAVAAGCGKVGDASKVNSPRAPASVEAGFKIGLLLPENKAARYEAFDKPIIEARLRAMCPKCTVLYQNARQDAAKQQTQADSLLSQDVAVIILDAVDAKAAASIVAKAEQQHVPVVAYGRLASGPVDYFVTFDTFKVGQAQAQALLDRLAEGGDPRRGPVVLIHGAITDPNSAAYKKGVHSILDGKVDIAFEVDTPDWSPDKAQEEMEQAMTRLGAAKIIGVYAANDGMASGVIAALKGHGVAPLPPVTGQDAELAAVQRVVSGDQYMTIYGPYADEAETAVTMALAVATGQKFAGATVELVNESGDKVPSMLLPARVVTRESVGSVIVKSGMYTVAEICTEPFATACKQAGL